MFNNYDNGYEEGGFNTSAFETGDTPAGDKKGPKRADSLVPVTIRQVHNCLPNGIVKIGQSNMETQTVKIVGIVMKINRSSVKVIFTVMDNTGTIDGIQWLEAEADDSYIVPVVENTYCTMIGSVREAQGSKHILIFQIHPVEDLNEVTAHATSIIYIGLKSEDLAQQKSMAVARPGSAMNSTHMSMDNSVASDNSFNLNPQQLKVLRAVQQFSNSEKGADVQQILSTLTVKIPFKEVEKIVDFLCSEGHVYSTSDDHHFKATDS